MDRSLRCSSQMRSPKQMPRPQLPTGRAAESKVKAARAALENAQRKLGYTKLVASQDGIVIAVGANSGEVVGAGQLVARLAVGNERDAVFDVAEENCGFTEDVVVNCRWCLTLRSLLRACSRIQPYGRSPTTRTTIGSRLELKTLLKRCPLAQPSPVKWNCHGDQVKLHQQQSHVKPTSLRSTLSSVGQHCCSKKVTVARYSDDTAFIIDGVNDGDRVVVAGVSKLRPGQRFSRAR